MNTNSAKELIEKYQAGSATAEEIELIESWVMLGRVTELDLSEAELAEDFKAIRSTLPLKYETKRVKLWPRVAGVALMWKVAAAVAAITLGIWIYYASSINGRHPDAGQDPGLAYHNDIAPGKNTATLTLANGKTIMLDTSKTNVVVTDSVRTMTMLTASTPRGGTYQVTLPDGTKVWLNADSKISFPSQFNGKERKILLEGEAYFAVVHNEKQPFLVESKGQVVEDIGTEFNINAYPNEGSIKTTLIEGSAKVNAVLLSPNEQASLNGDKILVTKVDPETAIAWKNNKFMFDSQGIEDIMKMVSRWYNVTVVYEGDMPEDKFGGSVSRFDNVSKVLRALEKTKNVRFRVEGRTIYVSK